MKKVLVLIFQGFQVVVFVYSCDSYRTNRIIFLHDYIQIANISFHELTGRKS